MPSSFGLGKGTATLNGMRPMILEIDTTKSVGLQYDINIFGSSPRLVVDWGDGSAPQTYTTTGTKSYTYSVGGTYQIKIYGYATSIGWDTTTTANTNLQKLTKVVDWGKISGLTNISGLCSRATNLTSVPAYIPPTITTAQYLFYGCTSFNQNIGSWNVSRITNFAFMFQNCSAFNNGGSSDIQNWSAPLSTTFNTMFSGCTVFNQPLTNLVNTSGVATCNMPDVFSSAVAFNQDIGGWNTTNAANFYRMFAGATAFNNGGSNTINNWNTGNVTQMNNMFLNAKAFNQPIGSWNTSKVTTMTGMFQNSGTGASAFNQNIGSWDVSKVSGFDSMFAGVSGAKTAFNNGGSSTINNWNVSAGTNFASMFTYSDFNQNIGAWTFANTGTVNFGSMFGGATAFNNGGSNTINNWNTSRVNIMGGIFNGATSFNQPIGSWNLSSCLNLSVAFSSASAFNQDLSGWGQYIAAIRPVMQNIFGNSVATKTAMSTENYSRTLIGWANSIATNNSDNKGKGLDVCSSSNQLTYHNVNYGGTPYSDAVAARAYLVNVGTTTLPHPNLYRSIACSQNGLTCLAGANGGYLQRSTDGGATWSLITSLGTTSTAWNAVAVSADGTKMAVGLYGGAIFTSADSGATWTTRVATSGSRNWTGIAISSDGTKIAACVTGGQIYTSSDSGATWTGRDSSRSWSAISMSSDGTKLVATVQNSSTTGYVYTSSDSGATWTARITDANRAWTSCCYSSDGTTIYATEQTTAAGTIRKSTDGGANWSSLSGWGTFGIPRGVSCSSDGSKIVLTVKSSGTGGGIVYSSNGGTSWTERQLSNNFPAFQNLLNGIASTFVYWDLYTTAIMSDDGQRIILRPTTFSSTVHRGHPICYSTDNGVNWSAGAVGSPTGAGWRITDGGAV